MEAEQKNNPFEGINQARDVNPNNIQSTAQITQEDVQDVVKQQDEISKLFGFTSLA